MAPHSSTLAWKIPWMEEPGRLWSMGSLLSDFTFTFHFHTLEKEMATQSSTLAWRIPGMGEPVGLPSMGLYRVRHDWSNLAAAAYPIVSAPFVQFFQIEPLAPLSKFNWPLMEGFISGFSILFTWSVPVLPRLVYCSFVVSFKIQKCGSNLVLFSQDYFGYSGCFACPYEF